MEKKALEVLRRFPSKWLLSLDNGGGLLRYRSSPKFPAYDDERMLFLAYLKEDGSIDYRGFFDDIMVVEAAHKSIFASWFDNKLNDADFWHSLAY